MSTMHNKKRVLANSIIVTGANILENFVFFMLNILVARYLSIENYGEYSTAIGVSTFFLTFCDIGINQNLFRSISTESKKTRLDAGSTIMLKGSLSIVTYGALLISLHISNYSASTIILTILFGFVRLFSDYLKTFFDLYDARERFLFSAILKLSFCIIVLLISIMILYCGKNYYWLFISRLSITLLFTAGIAVSALYGMGKSPQFDMKHSFLFFRECLPFGISSVLANFYQRINIIILSTMHGTDLSGIFSNAYMFFTTLLIIPGGVARALLPFLYKYDRHTGRLTFQYAFDLYAKYMAIIGFYIALMIFIFCSQAITLVFGEKYLPSIPILRIIALSIPFVFSVTGTIITTLDKQNVKTTIEVITVPISLAANLILIKFFKAEGAAFASLITYGSLFIGYHLYLHLSGLLNIRSAVTANLKLLAVSAFSFFIWDHFLGGIFFLVNVCIMSGLYISLAAVLLIRKEDVNLFAGLLKKGKPTNRKN